MRYLLIALALLSPCLYADDGDNALNIDKFPKNRRSSFWGLKDFEGSFHLSASISARDDLFMWVGIDVTKSVFDSWLGLYARLEIGHSSDVEIANEDLGRGLGSEANFVVFEAGPKLGFEIASNFRAYSGGGPVLIWGSRMHSNGYILGIGASAFAGISVGSSNVHGFIESGMRTFLSNQNDNALGKAFELQFTVARIGLRMVWR